MAERSWQFNDGETVDNAHFHQAGTLIGGRERQGLYDISTLQNYPLGYRLAFSDGRAFRYAHFSGAIPQGNLSAIDATSQVVLTSNAPFVNAAGTAADYAAGVRTMYLKHSNITTAHSSDALAGGFLHMTDESSEGYTYKIKSTTWTKATSILRVDLYDPLKELVDSEDSCAITGLPYKQCVIYNNAGDDIIAGVTMGDATAASYGWVQTWGVGTCLMDGTPTAGAIATGSDGVNGAVQVLGGYALDSEDDLAATLPTQPIVGYFLHAVPTTEYVPIFLTIAP